MEHLERLMSLAVPLSAPHRSRQCRGFRVCPPDLQRRARHDPKRLQLARPREHRIAKGPNPSSLLKRPLEDPAFGRNCTCQIVFNAVPFCRCSSGDGVVFGLEHREDAVAEQLHDAAELLRTSSLYRAVGPKRVGKLSRWACAGPSVAACAQHGTPATVGSREDLSGPRRRHSGTDFSPQPRDRRSVSF